MNLTEWLKKNRSNFGSEFEALFAETVLPLVPELHLEAVSVQYPFKDRDNKQRYCDFVVQENDTVRIAIEIDGFDKRGTGTGMSHADFIDWQRRQAALTSQGWYVLRFANRDVRDDPKRCAEHISLLLKSSRRGVSGVDLSSSERSRLNELTKNQESTIKHLKEETSVMKHTVTAFTALILSLVLIIVWLSDRGGGAGYPEQAQAFQHVRATEMPKPEVGSEQGLICRDGASPILNSSGVLVCPCDTDSDCDAKNPHLQFAPSQIQKQRLATPMPLGSSCSNPMMWSEARAHVGKTVAVVGPVMRITKSKNTRGNPSWVDIGGVFPNANRLVLVVWENKISQFPSVEKQSLTGQDICVIGKIEIFKGVPQVELAQAGQLSVVK